MPTWLPNSLFLHFPKTGGQWVNEVLKHEDLILDRYMSHAVKLRPRVRHHGTRSFVFCFVRHPLTWYRSFYGYRHFVKKNWNKGYFHRLLILGDMETSFPEWIERVLETYPDGYLNRFYPKYTEYCKYIGKYENLVENLIEALSLAGEDFCPKKVRKMGSHKANVGPRGSTRKQILYIPGQMESILKAEKKTVRQHGYDYVLLNLEKS